MSEIVSLAPSSPKKLVEALAAVMAELPNIGKGAKSPEGYAYRGIEQVTKHVQPLFAKHGIVIVPSAQITDVRPAPAMKEGWQDVYMTVDWTITGPDGSSLFARTNGIGRDKADKGANKAQTQAFKYLLLHLLCIADGKDDADSHSYENDRVEQPAKRAPRMADAASHKLLRERIAELSDDQKKQLAAWINEKQFPHFKDTDSLNMQQVSAITDQIGRIVRGGTSTDGEHGAPEGVEAEPPAEEAPASVPTADGSGPTGAAPAANTVEEAKEALGAVQARQQARKALGK